MDQSQSQSKEAKKQPEFIEISHEQAEELRDRIKNKNLTDQDYKLLEALINAYFWLLNLLSESKLSVKRLLRLFWKKSEKSRAILKGKDNNIHDGDNDEKGEKGEKEETDGIEAETETETETETEISDTALDKDNSNGNTSGKKNEKPKVDKACGHGRNGADSYVGAQIIPVPLEDLKAGDVCPGCETGKLYVWRPEDGKVLRIIGEVPIKAKIYHLQKLRCALCGEIYSAELPDEAGDKKYNEEAGSILTLLKYGFGMPFHRLKDFQANLGIPLPCSTQWEVTEEIRDKVVWVYRGLLGAAAQGEIFFIDDAPIKILDFILEEKEKEKIESKNKGSPGVSNALNAPDAPDDDNEKGSERKRKGTFTTGIIAKVEDHQIALYFSGRKHAGENLSKLSEKRDSSLPPPIQMCDALSRNIPNDFVTILCHCLIHGRRHFVDLAEIFTDESKYVIEQIGKVYQNERAAKWQELTPAQRLKHHQIHSGPVMNQLKEWFDEQLAEKKIEDNSSFGKAIKYMQKHWNKLTLFLQVEGAPLDNNIVERSLKMVILNRKNAYFYRTPNGAFTGDVFMSIIQTCKLANVNAFEYLTTIQKYTEMVQKKPSEWLPWVYKATMAKKNLSKN